jgi:hypothetical protein
MPSGKYERTEEVRRKQSERMKGKPGYWKDRKMTNAMKKKISERMKGQNTGSTNYGWKGGCWLYWRKQVLIRDDYTCLACGLRDEDIMHVAHIEPVNGLKERVRSGNHKNRLDNLVTLCPNDHARLDRGIISIDDIKKYGN